ncbi:hypothetical protein FPZ52_15890 (plasmid) [Qingshengfaniella alkalisoli]|uniref:Recombinase zinc beta ribbon domain-containing protein n=1 Tax=Qingshengfaniella alkalisoli TaxID=2599296 RepID=A0A5B8ICH9_9RHOB|nr:hypothetical protein FPZ52_15890 [Qingshengfaniella alkalisoli]
MNPAGVQDGGLRPERARSPTYLLSGLIKCGCCGATYTLINKTRYGCSAVRDKGSGGGRIADINDRVQRRQFSERAAAAQ